MNQKNKPISFSCVENKWKELLEEVQNNVIQDWVVKRKCHELCNFTLEKYLYLKKLYCYMLSIYSRLQWGFKLCAWVFFNLCSHLFVVSREHPWSGDQASYDAQCVITPPDSCVEGYLSLSTACGGSALGACQCQIFSIGELFCRCLTE